MISIEQKSIQDLEVVHLLKQVGVKELTQNEFFTLGKTNDGIFIEITEDSIIVSSSKISDVIRLQELDVKLLKDSIKFFRRAA